MVKIMNSNMNFLRKTISLNNYLVVKPQQNIKEYQLRGSIRPPQASEVVDEMNSIYR